MAEPELTPLPELTPVITKEKKDYADQVTRWQAERDGLIEPEPRVIAPAPVAQKPVTSAQAQDDIAAFFPANVEPTEWLRVDAVAAGFGYGGEEPCDSCNASILACKREFRIKYLDPFGGGKWYKRCGANTYYSRQLIEAFSLYRGRVFDWDAAIAVSPIVDAPPQTKARRASPIKAQVAEAIQPASSEPSHAIDQDSMAIVNTPGSVLEPKHREPSHGIDPNIAPTLAEFAAAEQNAEWLSVQTVIAGFGYKTPKAFTGSILKKSSRFYQANRKNFESGLWVKGRSHDDKQYHIDCIKAWELHTGKVFGQPGKTVAIVSPNVIPQDADFDSIQEPDGTWSGRKLAVLMGYAASGGSWDNFCKAVENAKMTIEGNTGSWQNHINEAINMVLPVGSGAERSNCRDYRLTEYACYAVALECDSSKPAVAAAKGRFIVAYKKVKMMESHPETKEIVDSTDSGIQQLQLGVTNLGKKVDRLTLVAERTGYANDRRQCLERHSDRLRMDRLPTLCDIPFWCSNNSLDIIKTLPNFQSNLPNAKGAYVIMSYIVKKISDIIIPQSPLCLYVGITDASFKSRFNSNHDCIDLFEILGDECKQVVKLCETESIHYEIFFYPKKDECSLKMLESKLTAIFEPVWLTEPGGASFKEYMQSMTNDLFPIIKAMSDMYITSAH
jgi:hypothetical protein